MGSWLHHWGVLARDGRQRLEWVAVLEELRMWVVAGVLLGVVALVALAGFHTGPHAHLVSGAVGALAAGALLAMVADGRSTVAVWALLGADVTISTVAGVTAWRALSRHPIADHRLWSPEGAEGTALGDLTPEGIVQVRGEQWSAQSVNGTIPAGSTVRILRATGVRLEVWGEDIQTLPPGDLFRLEHRTIEEERT